VAATGILGRALFDPAPGKFSPTRSFVFRIMVLFINSSFGAIPLVSQNLVPPIFPVAAPRIRLRVAPGESFYAEAAVFSGL
jgi:hypothetical protein